MIYRKYIKYAKSTLFYAKTIAYLNIFINKNVKGLGKVVGLHVHPDENVLHNVSGKVSLVDFCL